MTRAHLEKAEFYITNVCNLDCDHCNRFNNHRFRGSQLWSDYQPIYQRWGRLLDIDQLVILGGEPLLNPSIVAWINGLAAIWKPVQVQTNGTRINSVPGLYQALERKKAFLGISLHNINEMNFIDSEIKKFLQGSVSMTNLDPELQQGDILYVDENGVEIKIWIQNQFQSSAIKLNDQGKMTLHCSDVHRAHEICTFAQWKCYHFIRGKLYKCGPVALFPEFDQQHSLTLTAEDRELINAYQPLDLKNWDEQHQDFLARLDQPIPQCKFCPDYTQLHTIQPRLNIKNV